MPRQRHEVRLDAPITHVFAALIDVVARGRWGAAQIVLNMQQPRPGCEYAQQRRTVFRRGKVLECLRPVKLTIEETLVDRPCRVKLRLQWRLEPLDDGSCVLLEARYSLSGAAILRRRHWYERIHGHCTRMLGALRPQIAAARRALEEAEPARPPRRGVEPLLISPRRARRN
ncbi:MAG TPA: hypothetical protein VL131_06700 [Gammaproteobacteria bacterium]|nr:hypothetical protein [Gammaproteobacteria bacterium]